MASVSERFHPEFRIVFTAEADKSIVRVSGPIESQDQLDAVVEALDVIREWVSPEQEDRNDD